MEDKNEHSDGLSIYRFWHVFLYFASCYCLLSFLGTFILTRFYISFLDWVLLQPAPDYLLFLFMRGLIALLLQAVITCLSLYFAFKVFDRM